MTNKYCSSCGHPNSYVNGVAPIACASCGKQISVAFIPVVKPSKYRIIAKEEIEDGEEEFQGEIIVPRKFEVDVAVAKRITIGDLSNGATVPGLDSNLPSIPQD